MVVQKFISTILFIALTSLCYSQKEFQIDRKDVVITYRTYGEGNTILLINGGPGYSSSHLHSVAAEISKHYRVVLFDQRGTGKSTVSGYDSETINLTAILDDIEAIRNDLKLDSWIISGQSFGGLIAMAYAAKFAKRVDKLILISSAGLNLEFITSFQDNILNIIGKDTINYQMPANTSAKDYFLNMVDVNAPAYVFDKSKADVIRNILVDKESYVSDVNMLMWQDLFRNNFNLEPKLKTFSKPTLIVQGAQDIVGMDTAYKTHSVIPKSTLNFIRKCGHIPWLDRPVEFYSILFDFLDN
jgi:proline iminopeptidase